jgi:hypothetical protein
MSKTKRKPSLSIEPLILPKKHIDLHHQIII